MSDKIELMMLCGVLQSNFSCLSQSESRTQPCHARIIFNYTIIFTSFFTHGVYMGGRWEKVFSGCISETVMGRKLILGRDII